MEAEKLHGSATYGGFVIHETNSTDQDRQQRENLVVQE